MAAMGIGATVLFTNSAGRTITATVTRMQNPWVTIVETMGSAYKVPRSSVKLLKPI
jgi:hypothetical protein